MKYLFMSICVFLTLPVFADECKRNITIELFDNQTQIDSEEFKYFSKGKENKKERKIYSFPILYIEGKLYTIDMQEVTSLSSQLIDESGTSVDLYTTALSKNGVVITQKAEFNSNNFHDSNRIFTYDIFVNVDSNCTLHFDSKLQVSEFIKEGKQYRIIPDSIIATL